MLFTSVPFFDEGCELIVRVADVADGDGDRYVDDLPDRVADVLRDSYDVCRISDGYMYVATGFVDDHAGDAFAREVGSDFAELAAVQCGDTVNRQRGVGDGFGCQTEIDPFGTAH